MKYLLSKQRFNGGWRDSWVFMMEAESGRINGFRCDAAITAVVMEALCRYQLATRRVGPRTDRARRP